MKKCPKCHMTVDAYSECPVCGNNLTNESTADTDIERYIDIYIHMLLTLFLWRIIIQCP